MLIRTFAPFPVLKTERLTLRQLSVNDEQAIFILRSDAEINKYLDRKRAETHDDARLFIHTVNDYVQKNASLYWAITFKGKSELLGTICLYGFSDERVQCEIGYELLPEFQRQGIMQEAADAVVDYAFNTIGVKRLEAFFHRDNQRSAKLLEKLSFSSSNMPDTENPDLICYYLNSPDDNAK